MRISDWSSDVCSSDLAETNDNEPVGHGWKWVAIAASLLLAIGAGGWFANSQMRGSASGTAQMAQLDAHTATQRDLYDTVVGGRRNIRLADGRSEEHTSELQSLMRISYAVFCLKKKKQMKR